jgi:hypothetical protein
MGAGLTQARLRGAGPRVSAHRDIIDSAAGFSAPFALFPATVADVGAAAAPVAPGALPGVGAAVAAGIGPVASLGVAVSAEVEIAPAASPGVEVAAAALGGIEVEAAAAVVSAVGAGVPVAFVVA